MSAATAAGRPTTSRASSRCCRIWWCCSRGLHPLLGCTDPVLINLVVQVEAVPIDLVGAVLFHSPGVAQGVRCVGRAGYVCLIIQGHTAGCLAHGHAGGQPEHGDHRSGALAVRCFICPQQAVALIWAFAGDIFKTDLGRCARLIPHRGVPTRLMQGGTLPVQGLAYMEQTCSRSGRETPRRIGVTNGVTLSLAMQSCQVALDCGKSNTRYEGILG